MLAKLRSDYPCLWQEFEVSNHDMIYPYIRGLTVDLDLHVPVESNQYMYRYLGINSFLDVYRIDIIRQLKVRRK